MLAGVLGVMVWGAPRSWSAPITEPETVFYGQVVGTGSSRPFVLTEGTLRWTVRRSDGSPLELRARLWPHQNGAISYRLNVPHAALASGLTVEPGNIPLRSTPETQVITQITIDGIPARVAGGGNAGFETAQIRRAATHRLDLEVPIEAPDRDGDGLPDWWEALYGGDLRPGDDPDGDGWTNLEEYRRGSNPLVNDRHPTLLTTRLRAYADGTTGVLLRVQDADSTPGSLVYTITRLPAGADLVLRNAHPQPASPDAVLGVGVTFTQRDVLDGRLVLVHTGGAVGPGSFEISLRDENPAHQAATGTVDIEWYRPNTEVAARLATHGPGSIPGSGGPWAAGLTEAETQRVQNYLLSRDLGAVIWDAGEETLDIALAVPSSGIDDARYQSEYVTRFGRERRQVLQGGRGRDVLVGGMADDILMGGPGDDRLTGGGGADFFVIRGADAGSDTITDFNPDEGDVLDIGGLFQGSSRDLRDFLRIEGDASGTRLRIHRGGNPAGASDHVVTLAGVSRDDLDLHDWIEAGTLRVGERALPPRVTVTASQPRASENGPTEGEFTLLRTGDAAAALSVRIDLRGSAVNGVDYASIGSSVVFPAGQRAVRVTVLPYQDSHAEPDETVALVVLPGDGYEVGGADHARVIIADLRPVVSLEALEPLATVQPPGQGTILVSRTTVVDRSLLVRLEIGGTATPGSDYNEVSRFVHLVPGQTTALVPVVPAAGASFAGGARSVRLTVAADPEYLRGPEARAEVLLVQEATRFAAWRARHFPAENGTLAAFGAADAGNQAIPNALRYAFGMDPENPDRARLPKVVVRDGHLTLDVHRRPGTRDVEFVIETSGDLAGWKPASALIERVYPPDEAERPDIVCYRLVPSIQEAPHLFLNLRVVLRP